MNVAIEALLGAFARRLREERIGQGQSQEEFARWGKVSKNSQFAYENAKTPPTVEYLFELLTWGVDIGYLISGRRETGDLGQRDKWLIESFDALSQRERDAVMQLMATLSGRTVALEVLGSGEREVGTLHSGTRPFQGEARNSE
jgi:transcriptional regulator with XRE-family HTH domain